uniref:Uncharacterized protein n=1 Tax=Lotus japonicus TaxID=34305 RepID=I3S883_LOTJA|nr:unknown [Lotus japonicus]
MEAQDRIGGSLHLQQLQASDTSIIHKPSHKAIWFWDESRCQAVPEMKCQ